MSGPPSPPWYQGQAGGSFNLGLMTQSSGMVAVPPCAECGAPASRIELIAPGDHPAGWEEWPASRRDTFARKYRDLSAWHLLVDGPGAGSGLGQAVTEARAGEIARALAPPLTYEKIHTVGFYDDAGFCAACGVPYCGRHWNISDTGFGTCPRGHGKSLDPHWWPADE